MKELNFSFRITATKYIYTLAVILNGTPITTSTDWIVTAYGRI